MGLTVAGALLSRQTLLRGSVGFAGLLGVYAAFFSVLEVTVKRIHFLEYSCLSLLTDRALRPRVLPPRRYLWSLLLTLGVGAVEEGIEVFLPRRFGAISDVLFDVAGGTLGALFVKFVLRAG